jgi:hypothetical protein
MELFGWMVQVFAQGMDYRTIHTQDVAWGGLMKLLLGWQDSPASSLAGRL